METNVKRLTEPRQRYIKLSSIIYFSVILASSWEYVSITFQFALLNGGPSAMVYGCILVSFGGSAVAFSLAEMASMYVEPFACKTMFKTQSSLTSYRDPVVGAQYRWSMKFAP